MRRGERSSIVLKCLKSAGSKGETFVCVQVMFGTGQREWPCFSETTVLRRCVMNVTACFHGG